LKGRFQSLKVLHIRICDETSHCHATHWIVECIVVHAFTMQCEAEEHEEVSEDSFIAEGLLETDDESDSLGTTPSHVTDHAQAPHAGKAWREKLK